jgi:PAS domain-containing protein
MEQIQLLKKRLSREKSARSQAEELLEKKSLELFNLNKALEKQNLTLHQEIDDREKAEKILEEKTTLLNNLFSNSMESSIAATDLNLRITYFNTMAEKLFGYKAKEVIGKTVHEIHVMENVAPERLESAIGLVKKKVNINTRLFRGPVKIKEL